MNAKEWLKKNNVDLSKYHGNVGDYDGNVCIERKDGTWEFWSKDGAIEEIKSQTNGKLRRSIYDKSHICNV